jgi:hypothetical protein
MKNIPVGCDSVPFCLVTLGTNKEILIAYRHSPTYALFTIRKSGASRIVQKFDFSTQYATVCVCRRTSSLNRISTQWHIIGGIMTAPLPLLSSSSIIPLCLISPFISTREFFSHFSKLLLFHFLLFKIPSV